MPHPSQDQHSSYAKNVTIADSLPDKTLDASQLSASLQNSFNPIVNWAQQNHLTIAPSKSSVTLFTPWTKQFNAQPRVTCQNTELPREKTPKILGVTLDPSFTFTPHAKSKATKCSQRLRWRILNNIRLSHHVLHPISPEEESLPRPHRASLSQLCSGFCKALNRYRADIGLTNDPSCPSCGSGSHDPPHLFTCPSHPSRDLNVGDLWARPVQVTHSLLTLPCFHYSSPLFPHHRRSHLPRHTEPPDFGPLTPRTRGNEEERMLRVTKQTIIHQLHAEAKILPAKEHLRNQPSYNYVTQPSGPRASHQVSTLQPYYLPSIQQYLANNQTPPGENVKGSSEPSSPQLWSPT